MVKVFVSLGSNVGNREDNIYRTIKCISRRSKVLRVSSFYATSPLGYKKQPEFLNCVLSIETNFGPMSLLKYFKKVEKILGRVKTFRWGPRVIDIDIIFYGNAIIQTNNLIIPHPEMHLRKFVLIPLCEIEKKYIHPLLKQNVLQLLDKIYDDKQTVRKYCCSSLMANIDNE